MAFWLNLLRLARRRNVALLAAASSVVLATAAFLAVPAVYMSTATVVLTTSPTNQAAVSGDPNASPTINPLLNFYEGLNTALAILVQALNTAEAKAALDADDGRTSVQITDIGGAEFLGNKGPFMFITASSTASGDAARDMVVRTEKLAERELKSRQQEMRAPESQLISLLFVVSPTQAITDWGGRYKSAAFAFVFGLCAVIGGAYVLEVAKGNRLRRMDARFGTELVGDLESAPSPEPPVIAVEDGSSSTQHENRLIPAASDSPSVAPSLEGSASVSPDGEESQSDATHNAPHIEARASRRPRPSLRGRTVPGTDE